MRDSMTLGADITKKLEKDGFVVFRDQKTGQPFALFEIEDIPGAVSEFTDELYIVSKKKR